MPARWLVEIARRDHRELIAAEARDQVVAAQGPAQALGDAANQLVADRVTEGVVDVLEVVEIDVEHRRGAASLPRLGDDRFEPLTEEDAIGQSAQRIVQGEVSEPGFTGRDGGGGTAHISSTSPASSAKPASATAMKGMTLWTISAPGCFGVQAKWAIDFACLSVRSKT